MRSFLLLLGLLFPLSLLTTSCGLRHGMIVAGDAPPAAVYSYWYYPAIGVYYDYDARVYFYLEGSTWVRVNRLPPRYRGLGRHVIVESERGRPWIRYEAHRAKHPPGHGRGKHHHDDY